MNCNVNNYIFIFYVLIINVYNCKYDFLYSTNQQTIVKRKRILYTQAHSETESKEQGQTDVV